MKRIYRKDLDAIKAIAIIAVVFYHMGLLKSGYLGVDTFFVINGFFVVPSMCSLFPANQKYGLIQYWLKRVMRLWPLILIASFVSLCIGYFVMLPDDYENLSESVIASNFFSENIIEAITTKNYWDVQNEYKPLMHLWYVGVLFEFYILTPIILWVSYKFSQRFKFNKAKTDSAVLALLTLLSFAIYIGPFATEAEKFYFIPSRFWEISIGGLIALSYNKFSKFSIFHFKPFNAFAVVGLISLILIGLIIPDYAAQLALIAVVIISSILLIGKNHINILNVLLTNRTLCNIGKMSFSIFVWHQVILAFYRYVISEDNDIAFVVVYLSVVILLSCLTYYLIEQKVNASFKSFAVSCSAMLIIAIPSFAIYMHAGVVRDVPELNIRYDNVHRHMHAEYVDRIYDLDKPFTGSKKIKVLVVGNSFARDWSNILLESSIKDKIEISYSFSYKEEIIPRIKQCDILFSGGYKSKIPDYVWNYIDESKVYGIGTKGFGTTNGQIYAKRFDDRYYHLVASPEEKIEKEYEREKIEWGGGNI